MSFANAFDTISNRPNPGSIGELFDRLGTDRVASTGAHRAGNAGAVRMLTGRPQLVAA